MADVESLINRHIREMEPYSSARDEFEGNADVFLDANESWYSGECDANRYPDPRCRDLRKLLESTMNLPFDMTAIGNGSDEVIDLLMRMFCREGDSVMVSTPTYGEYRVFASTNNLRTIDVSLKESLELDADGIIAALGRENPKIVFICTPNNPTGRVYPLSDVRRIADANSGITVVDEAYSDFAEGFESAVSLIAGNPRVVVMRTLSKSWGLAGARVGILVADPVIQRTFVKMKPPYNVSLLNQRAAIRVLSEPERYRDVVSQVIADRKIMERKAAEYPFVREVIPSEANFIVIRTDDADRLYRYLLSKGIIVRNRTKERYLSGCLRITIGSKEENRRLMEALDGYEAC
ncbi:MAG: histidinol-phosphate transaminase [Candidatus Ornithospirochaeta sp.]|nr:histidinol-phosphate transaminase [Candidatus Ornithospirochaeta sp.]